VSTLSPVERRERRKRRRREELVRWGIRVGLVLLIFLFGLAVGQALQDNPYTGKTVTLERTLTIPTGSPGETVSP
jgi:hypothetical protein